MKSNHENSNLNAYLTKLLKPAARSAFSTLKKLCSIFNQKLVCNKRIQCQTRIQTFTSEKIIFRGYLYFFLNHKHSHAPNNDMSLLRSCVLALHYSSKTKCSICSRSISTCRYLAHTALTS